jgi:hypothetical protein
VPALGVVDVALEPISVPEAVPVLPVVPEAPMDVPLPVVVLALVSVLGVVGLVVAPVPDVVVSLGSGVDGTVVVELLDEVEDSGVVVSRSPQADRDRAAIRARAAHVIGDLIIRNSFEGFVSNRESGSAHTRCLRLTLVAHLSGIVGARCRRL